MFGLNVDQVKGIVERLVTVALTYAVAKGLLSAETVAPIVAAVVAAAAAIYAWWINRNKALAQSASAIPGTTVVTTPEIAASTPETNIVSNATTEVVHK